VFIPWASLSMLRVWNWVPVAEVDRVAHRVMVFPQAPQPVQAPLFSPYPWKLQPPYLPQSYRSLPDRALAMWVNKGQHPASSQYKETYLGAQDSLQLPYELH
jgi:hypothetical protein